MHLRVFLSDEVRPFARDPRRDVGLDRLRSRVLRHRYFKKRVAQGVTVGNVGRVSALDLFDKPRGKLLERFIDRVAESLVNARE